MVGEVSGGESPQGPQGVGGAESLDHDPARRPRLAIAHHRRAAGVAEAEEAIGEVAGEEQGAAEGGLRGIVAKSPCRAKAAQGPLFVSKATWRLERRPLAFRPFEARLARAAIRDTIATLSF